LIVGCDINEACRLLKFESNKINIVIGDSKLDDTYNKIKYLSKDYDIIIDDGSHKSSDIIKSFCLYFPLLEYDGVYIVEDLHCSYWVEFEGGFNYEYSAISFFKKLIDCINYEHWGINKTKKDYLKDFEDFYGISIDDNFIAEIHSIEFINSVCVIKKNKSHHNLLGFRVVSGKEAHVADKVKNLKQTFNLVKTQVNIKKNEEYCDKVTDFITQLFFAGNNEKFLEINSLKVKNQISTVFDLSSVDFEISKLRFDLSTRKCVISNLSCKIIDEFGNKHELVIIRHNATFFKDNKYYFDTTDSQIHFDVAIKNIKAFEYSFDIEPLDGNPYFEAAKTLEQYLHN
jgi:hypothetical protein